MNPEVNASQRERAGNSSTSSAIVEKLRSDILHNRLSGGDRLRQDAIATEYGVSQMIVREAFKQLTTEGFLKAEPRRGVSVARLSSDEAWEVSQLRALLECQALRWAIPSMVRRELVWAKSVLDELDASANVDARIQSSAKFHELLYLPANQPRTLHIIKNLRLSFERYLRYTWEETHHSERSQVEHREILRLCEMGDVERACEALRLHILATGKLLVDSLRTRESVHAPSRNGAHDVC